MQEYRNIIIKLIVTLFLLVIIGLPINDIINFSLFIFCITVIIFSKILIKKNYFFYFIILSILFSAYSFIPTLKIHEEHNIIIFNNVFSPPARTRFVEPRQPTSRLSAYADSFTAGYLLFFILMQ